ncbi:MAG: hypothetical protein E7Z65_07785 [Thermoplasmata archaeon]|nr:hypothetical protein [Thermoplasmata archaeon]
MYSEYLGVMMSGRQRITILFGAGASIDLAKQIMEEYQIDGGVGTKDLTFSILNEDSIFSKKDSRVKLLVKYCFQYLKDRYNEDPTFEMIYEMILILKNTVSDMKPILCYDASDIDYDYDGVLCLQTLYHILYVIHDKLHEYRLKTNKQWVVEFINTISSEYGFKDIFNLNYDDLLDDLFKPYDDGFTVKGSIEVGNVGSYYGFDVKGSVIPDSCNLLNHLHGSIHFFNGAPSGESYDSPMFKYEIPWSDIFLQVVTNQNQTETIFSPIITGLDKMNSMVHVPYNYYHSNLLQSMRNNCRLIIIGYGFGDYYINAQILYFKRNEGNRILYISPDMKNKFIDTIAKDDNLSCSEDERFWWFKGTFKEAAQYESNTGLLSKVINS